MKNNGEAMPTYIEILQERFTQERLEELFADVKFFMEGEENIKIRQLKAQGDPRVRKNYRFNKPEADFLS